MDTCNASPMHRNLCHSALYCIVLVCERGFISASRQLVGESYPSWLHEIDSADTCLQRKTLISTESGENTHHAYKGLL